MYSVVFLTQFWPTCGMVHITTEMLISSWYIYEIKIHIKYLLPHVWNKIIAYLPTYQSKKGELSQNRVHVHYQEQEKSTKGRFFIAKSITVD